MFTKPKHSNWGPHKDIFTKSDTKNPEKFLFEANDLTRFTAFVAINEASALRMFSQIRPAISGATDELKNEIEDIIDDETD